MNHLAPIALQTTAADFSNDTIWIVILKAVGILVFLLLSVLFALWFERRLIGRFQQRLGPNWVGPLGLFQAIADAGKLLLKEEINVKRADKFLYLLAPVISVVCAFLIFAVVPFGPEVSIFGIVTPLQLTDMPVAVLYILAITGMGVYGLVLGGWSSGSTYPLLGAVRSTAQVISYELGMSLALVSVLLVSGTMSTSAIVNSQERLWWAIMLFPAFIVYVISMVGETNRLPFDLPEAEGELVGGFQTEYSSMKFAWFYLAEYINMLNVSAVAVTLFLGGWRAPWPLSAIGDGMLNEGWWPFLWFLVKLWMMMGLFVWLRATLLRFRYDQFMTLGWKVLIPVALAYLVILAVWQGLQHFGGITVEGEIFGIPTRFVLIGAAVILLGVALFFGTRETPEEKPVADTEREPEVIDPYAGGFPVPPLPGQVLPPSPRRVRVTAPAPADEEKNDE